MSGDDNASFTASPEKVRPASQSAAALMSWWQVLRQWVLSGSADTLLFSHFKKEETGANDHIQLSGLNVAYSFIFSQRFSPRFFLLYMSVVLFLQQRRDEDREREDGDVRERERKSERLQ